MEEAQEMIEEVDSEEIEQPVEKGEDGEDDLDMGLPQMNLPTNDMELDLGLDF